MDSAGAVLIVDDDPGLREMLESVLGYNGFAVTTAASVPDAIVALDLGPPDVVVLDVMLPGVDGFDFLQLLRRREGDLPVLFLSARDSVEDRVRGLALGADDYVTKPFSIVEVDARLRALIRRARRAEPESSADGVLRYADLEFDEATHRVVRDGSPVTLSPTEFRLLEYLLRNAERVVSKSEILEAVWQYDFGGDAGVVERFVSNLRRKLGEGGDGGRAPLVHTIRGFGYTLRRDPPG